MDVPREAKADDDSEDEDFSGAACPAYRRQLWDVLEKPDSSRAARTFGMLSIFFVVASIINMALISLDLGHLGDGDMDFSTAGNPSGPPLVLDVLEYACVVWFTGELGLRFLCARDKCRFSRSVPNVIDLLAKIGRAHV